MIIKIFVYPYLSPKLPHRLAKNRFPRPATEKASPEKKARCAIPLISATYNDNIGWMLKCATCTKVDVSITINSTGFLTIYKMTSLLEYCFLSFLLVTFSCISFIPNKTIIAERKIVIETDLNVTL